MEQRKMLIKPNPSGHASKFQSLDPLSVEASRVVSLNKDPYAQAANKRKLREEKSKPYLTQKPKLMSRSL